MHQRAAPRRMKLFSTHGVNSPRVGEFMVQSPWFGPEQNGHRFFTFLVILAHTRTLNGERWETVVFTFLILV